MITFKGKWSVVWYVYFLMNIVFTIGQVTYLTYQTTIPGILEVFLTFVFVLEIICKLLVMFIERKTISKMYKVVEEVFWDISVVDEENEQKLVRHFSIVYLFARFHFISSGFVAALVMFFPATEYPEGMKNIPMLIYMPFDANPSPLHEFLFLFFALNGIFCVFAIYVYDYLFIYFAQHLIVQFKLVKRLLENLAADIADTDDLEKYSSEEFQAECHKRMSICVKHHNNLLGFGQDLMGLASVASGLQAVFSIIIGVIIEFLVGWAMEKGDTIRSVKLTTVLLCMYNEMTIFAFHGSEIQYESSSIATAAYTSDWYLFRGPLRKGLAFIQLNAHKELKIMGFKLFEINNNTVIALARTTFSIVTLLRAMN